MRITLKHTFAKVIILCMIGANLSACASSVRHVEGSNDPSVRVFKPVDNEDKNKAVLYIYRPYGSGSALAAPVISINNLKIVILRNQRYVWVLLDPGKYVIETRRNSDWELGKEDAYQLVAESGRNYFLRVPAETNFHLLLLLTGNPPLDTDFPLIAVKESEALPELNEVLYLEPERNHVP